MTSDKPEFGRDPNHVYVTRPSAYGVILDARGRIATCRLAHGHFLPGGGIDPGEDGPAALRREVREELGYEATVGAKIGVATQFYVVPDEGNFEKVGHFFHARLESVRGPGEPDHQLAWLDRSVVLDALNDEFQRWAVARALGL